MRLIGAAERGMQLMVQRAISRRAFDKLIAEHGSFLSDAAKVRFLLLAFLVSLNCLSVQKGSSQDQVQSSLALFIHLALRLLILQCRVDLERTRLLVLEAADELDRVGNKKARGILAMAKVHTYLAYI